MTNTCDKNGNPLPDADRQIPLGRFLRATSLDELPGLWCVFSRRQLADEFVDALTSDYNESLVK
jgi:hypothetical protein